MHGKELFDHLHKLQKSHSTVSGFVVIDTDDEGDKEVIFNESNVIPMFGLIDEEEAADNLKDSEVFKDLEDGCYHFQALLTFNSAQIGDYEPPNIEVPEHYCVDYIEFFKQD